MARFSRCAALATIGAVTLGGCRGGQPGGLDKSPPPDVVSRTPQAGSDDSSRSPPVPVSEDFELRARQEITRKNMDRHLADLEVEIGPVHE